jgi:ActR/RegA family two-component response regulator
VIEDGSTVVVTVALNDDGERRDILDEVRAAVILRVYDTCGGSVSEAARRLGMHRQNVQRWLRRLGR